MIPNHAASKARVAVVIPYFEASETIGGVVSALASSTIPLDIIVVDDASPTPAPSHLVDMAAPMSLQIVTRECNNAAGALNTGVDMALSAGYEFIAINDADDVPHKDKFAKQVEYMGDNPDVGLVGAWANTYLGATGEFLWVQSYPTSHDAIVKAMRFNAAFVHSTYLYRANVLRDCKLYDEELPVAKDYDMALRMSKITKLANIPEPLLDYYVWTSSISVVKRRRQVLNRLRLQWRHLSKLDPLTWAGMIKSCLLLAAPLPALNWAKQLAGSIQLRGGA